MAAQVASLQRLDAGAMYFWMKDLTQEFLKLSIIYSSVEILDKVPCNTPVPHPQSRHTRMVGCVALDNCAMCRSFAPSGLTRWRRWRPPARCMLSATASGRCGQLVLRKTPLLLVFAHLLPRTSRACCSSCCTNNAHVVTYLTSLYHTPWQGAAAASAG